MLADRSGSGLDDKKVLTSLPIGLPPGEALRPYLRCRSPLVHRGHYQTPLAAEFRFRIC